MLDLNASYGPFAASMACRAYADTLPEPKVGKDAINTGGPFPIFEFRGDGPFEPYAAILAIYQNFASGPRMRVIQAQRATTLWRQHLQRRVLPALPEP